MALYRELWGCPQWYCLQNLAGHIQRALHGLPVRKVISHAGELGDHTTGIIGYPHQSMPENFTVIVID